MKYKKILQVYARTIQKDSFSRIIGYEVRRGSRISGLETG